MGYPDLVRRAQQAWSEHSRSDIPRMVAMTYVALGAERRRLAADYLRHYYSYVGPKAEALAANVISEEDRLREVVTGYAAAGCDELLIFPCTADVEQLAPIAKVAMG